jgi:two-component system, OmpR family, sensor histidine kinase TctE
MSSRGPRAASIRRRLLIFLLPPLTLLMLAGVYINYRSATVFVRAAYDQRLADMARVLAKHVQVTNGLLKVDPAPLSDYAGTFTYSVVGADGSVITGDGRLRAASAGGGDLSFADSELDGKRLRVATYRLHTAAGLARISVADMDESRSGPGHFILASTWLVDFIQVDVTLLIVWIAVHFGLKPVVVMRRQIEDRSARELRPLDVDSVPSEVRPLVDALNLLFEMLSAAARAQRQFVADTAHQLRTPIAGLLGSLQVLIREPAAAPIQGRLALLQEGVHRLSHSANQLLVLARADPATSLAERFQRTDLKSVVERVIERNVDRAVEGGLDLGAESLPASVNANARLLEDLLSNLVDNALNYTPSGGRVTVRSGYEDGNPYLEVEDDGPGIPEPERARVRERFYRLPGSPAGGCGLGLAIVDEIARQHGARLSIDTGAEGRGVNMKVLFPAGVPPAED